MFSIPNQTSTLEDMCSYCCVPAEEVSIAILNYITRHSTVYAAL